MKLRPRTKRLLVLAGTILMIVLWTVLLLLNSGCVYDPPGCGPLTLPETCEALPE